MRFQKWNLSDPAAVEALMHWFITFSGKKANIFCLCFKSSIHLSTTVHLTSYHFCSQNVKSNCLCNNSSASSKWTVERDGVLWQLLLRAVEQVVPSHSVPISSWPHVTVLGQPQDVPQAQEVHRASLITSTERAKWGQLHQEGHSTKKKRRKKEI